MSKGRLILYITKALHQTSTAYYDLERIVQQVNNGSYEYFLPDSLGSVRQVAGDNQFPSYSQSFDPFGNIVSWEGKGGSSFGYVGETNDPSGLVFLRARFYSPTQGRFITRDPFPGIITAPVTLTQYNYSLNNPILFTDPSGQTVPLIVAVAGIGFAAGAVIDAFQQTNGFTDFCDFDLLQSLSAGIGGAAAATSLAIFTISGIGYFGLGL